MDDPKASFTVDDLGEPVPIGDRTFDDLDGYAIVPEGRASVTVTSRWIQPQTKVFANLQDNTDAIYLRSVVPFHGGFTINLSGATSGARLVSFFIIK
jgi:hypothetical protein